MTFSIFILGLAFAPFPIASMSEMYGRKPVWLFCNAFYVLWNALCPVGHSPALMVIGRFLAGSGASVGITVCVAFHPSYSPCLYFIACLVNRPYHG